MVSSDSSKSRVLLVVTDGLGYSPTRVRSMAQEVWTHLSDATKSRINTTITRDGSIEPRGHPELRLMCAAPRWIEVISPETNATTAQRLGRVANQARAQLKSEGMMPELHNAWRAVGNENRYVPWIAEVPKWSDTVNNNLTFPTHASGTWVGYEDVDPPVNGNSETGHQQIGNFALAPQIPLEISQAIADGSFHQNPIFNTAIESATHSGGTVNLIFLLSGITGSEGRVHSAWNHLEAMLELLFTHRKLNTSQVRIQAILDGRDAPAHGSMKLDHIADGYLGELQRLLQRHNAEQSLAWVIGRSIAMDRDYREDCAKSNYLLLTEGHGQRANTIADVRRIVADFHAKGGTDADVPPIAVCHGEPGAPTISNGDSIINLNFRSDRQRATTATLAGARNYLIRESAARSRQWSTDWINDDLQLNQCTIAEYDPEFEARYGAKVAFQTRPHALNILSAWAELTNESDTYLLVAESVKASHMGFFIRGRRELPENPDAETRWITPSAAADEGVASDSDFYKSPTMRTREIVERVTDAMRNEDHRIIICNIAAPDMIGHLLPTRYQESIAAYSAASNALMELCNVAAESDVNMIITSDHGNIEEDAPTHTSNPVLTTIIPSPSDTGIAPTGTSLTARLYDIPHCVATMLSIDANNIASLIENSGTNHNNPDWVGRSLIE